MKILEKQSPVNDLPKEIKALKRKLERLDNPRKWLKPAYDSGVYDSSLSAIFTPYTKTTPDKPHFMTLDRQRTAYKFTLDGMDGNWYVLNCGKPEININTLHSILFHLGKEYEERFNRDFQTYLGRSTMLVLHAEPTQFEQIFEDIITPVREYLLYSL